MAASARSTWPPPASYTIGGAFWEFGAPDWERTKLFVLFGVAEDHDSNPIKMGIAKLKARGARFVSVNPVRTGYSAVADNWIGVRPGTDGLLILSLVHELLKARRIDVDYLIRYSNAAWLVIDAPGSPEHGLFAREDGKPLIYDSRAGAVAAAAPGLKPSLSGRFQLADGRNVVPVIRASCRTLSRFRLFARTGLGPHCGMPAETIRGLAAELGRVAFDEAIAVEVPWTDMAGERHPRFIGRPVSFHAMRGISAHSNGFQTAARCTSCRCCSARSSARAASASSRPTRSRSRPVHPEAAPQVDARQAARRAASRLSARPGGSGDRRRRPAEAASTRPSPGKRRSPPTA